MIIALLLIPLFSGLACFVFRSVRLLRGLLLLSSFAHLALVGTFWSDYGQQTAADSWFALDGPALIFLSIASLLFLAISFYSAGSILTADGTTPPADQPLNSDGDENQTPDRSGGLFGPARLTRPQLYSGFLLFFLATMTLVTVSRHPGILWVAIEATTLASAPLIYFERKRTSLEAMWKYLLICSVGIALALLGTFFLIAAVTEHGDFNSPLFFDGIIRAAPRLNRSYLSLSFILLFVGYGTKMGLVPLHTWLPDAHSESPSPVSALLSGALLNCAFLGILRAHQIVQANGQGDFSRQLLIVFGLLSMGFAVVFIIRQRDYKRLLAYSSVEHVGILSLAVGLGGAGVLGGMLHAVNHSLTKGLLFLIAGNILHVYHSKSTDIRGIREVLPVSGVLWLGGLLALGGMPPFSPFVSEFIILKAALAGKHYIIAILFLLFLSIIFIVLASTALRMVQGVPGDGITLPPPGRSEGVYSVLPPLVLFGLILLLGLYVPQLLLNVVGDSAVLLGGTP